ncbi:MAG TPA: TOBE domain-containing protein [Methylocystis sp.]|nr:TOBE domain-containing protein [Methylocystis sp.]
MALSQNTVVTSQAPPLSATVDARVLRHDVAYGLSTLFFNDGELRAPLVKAPVDAGVRVRIDARDVSIALSRPMDVSITNRLPGKIVALEPLPLPFVRVTFNLGATDIYALVTAESVERLALEPGLKAWVMIKSVAIDEEAVLPATPPKPRRWRVVRNPD